MSSGWGGHDARLRTAALIVALLTLLLLPAAVRADAPAPGSPEYVQRDNQNIAGAYGRQTAPDGQLGNQAYNQAIVQEHSEWHLQQLAQQVATPGRLAISAGNVFPGWNGGNPLRRGWTGRRGLRTQISYTNRYGALIRGDVFAPLPGARDPYTGARLKPPYPGVVITTGSIQGSERMYWWLAQDLAERGYVVLTYDVQGQGTSETLPHENDEVNALPFCNPFAEPRDGEDFGCPGVPFQQSSNFIFGTEDALDFFMSTPKRHYPNPNGGDVPVNSFNPYWRLFDRSKDRHPATPGRRTRLAIVGHSLGAAAVSYVQGVDKRVAAVVAMDKLAGGGEGPIQTDGIVPKVPALAVQSEYGFNVYPYWMSGGSSVQPRPGPPSKGPDPRREQRTGFDVWRKAGVDTMLVVPRSSTHLEYTDIAYVLPASRYGQALTSSYAQAWLDRYLKHRGVPKRRRAKPHPALAASFRYLEPIAVGQWTPVQLKRSDHMSIYYCSGYSLRDPRTGRRAEAFDLGGVGGCQ